MAASLAVGFARAAWGILNPLKHKTLKVASLAADFGFNDGEMTKGTLDATGEALDGNFLKAADELGSSIKHTFQNITGTGEHATPEGTETSAENDENEPTLRERARDAISFASDVANGKNPLTGNDGEDNDGGVGGLFNSVMSGDIFNMDNAKTAGKWGLGGFLLYKIFDWLKDSFTGGNKDNENNGGGGISSALTLAVVIGAGAFIYNKYGDDIKNGLGIGDDKPEANQDRTQPRPQNLDNALQGYDM